MLKGIHFLLTYTCTFECDHCFLYCGPNASGTFTLKQIREVLDDADTMGSVEWIFFEGGEPFLFYPLMLEGITAAKGNGFKIGIVTNGYWATCVEDARIWLKPLKEAGISALSISDDSFHYGDHKQTPAKFALDAAAELDISSAQICIEKPQVRSPEDTAPRKAKPVVDGGPRFKGRAAEKLTMGLPLRACETCTHCPDEDLENPERVHMDPYGNVHLCQGLIIGNTQHMPLSKIMADYSPDAHPICGPLAAGGPALLAQMYKVKLADSYVDECHMCYEVRKALIDRFPRFLAPRQVYGLE